jgi:hypothetical protein
VTVPTTATPPESIGTTLRALNRRSESLFFLLYLLQSFLSERPFALSTVYLLQAKRVSFFAVPTTVFSFGTALRALDRRSKPFVTVPTTAAVPTTVSVFFCVTVQKATTTLRVVLHYLLCHPPSLLVDYYRHHVYSLLPDDNATSTPGYVSDQPFRSNNVCVAIATTPRTCQRDIVCACTGTR